MKRFILMLLTLILTFSLVACASGNGETANNNEQTQSVTDTSEQHSIENGKKILVAYFSATGTTKQIAEYASASMGADLYDIVPAQPYTSADLNYNTDCRANREQNDDNARPEINGKVENMADYDIIFIGYPIWWGKEPKIVLTFVEGYDFSGKTIVTFSTSGSSAHNDSSIKGLISGASLITGKRMNDCDSQSAVAEWINSLGLGIKAE